VSHELRESSENIELSVSAPTREELFRDALAGVLEAACGASLAEEIYEGRVVPVQASGGDDDTLLADLVDDTLRAVREEPGTLRPPRWLSFDEKRVTATLPLHTPKVPVRALEVGNAAVDSSAEGWSARLELLPIPAA
jgi:SHS2 domain-containing protein